MLSYNVRMNTVSNHSSSSVSHVQKITAVVCNGGNVCRARALAEQLGVPFYKYAEAVEEPYLLLCTNGLALVSDGMEMKADFEQRARRLDQRNLHRELLVKAAKIKPPSQGNNIPIESGITSRDNANLAWVPRAIDATAGLGDDALLLAAAGFEVALYERDPVIAALLDDALLRAQQGSNKQVAAAAQRMYIAGTDSIRALTQLDYKPDVIYLDPMFPERKKSAAVKKKFQLLHVLEAPATDDDALLQAALCAHPRKIVIKRPLKGPYVGNQKPSYSLNGKAIRYDVVVPA